MKPVITTEAIVAYAHCPRKAYLLLYGNKKGTPHEYVRILEDKPYFKHAAARVKVIDRNNQREWDPSTTLAPRGFRAIFSVQE